MNGSLGSLDILGINPKSWGVEFLSINFRHTIEKETDILHTP
jgi:hypothetical protein